MPRWGTTEELLKQGRVPAAPIQALVNHWRESEGLSQEEVCRGAKVGVSSLAPIQKTLDFDAADRLLCYAGLVGAWRGELRELYEGVNLTALDEGRHKKGDSCARGHKYEEGTWKPRPNPRNGKTFRCCLICKREDSHNAYLRRKARQKKELAHA